MIPTLLVLLNGGLRYFPVSLSIIPTVALNQFTCANFKQSLSLTLFNYDEKGEVQRKVDKEIFLIRITTFEAKEIFHRGT